LDEEEEVKKKQILEDQFNARKQKMDSIRLVREMSNDELKERQDVPAYLRKGVKLGEQSHSSETNRSRYRVNEDNELLGGNRFLHDNVD
jgi:cell division protein FtsZ